MTAAKRGATATIMTTATKVTAAAKVAAAAKWKSSKSDSSKERGNSNNSFTNAADDQKFGPVFDDQDPTKETEVGAK